MAERSKLNADRDLFYLSLGGFDQHHNAKDNNNRNFADIDNSINQFKQEMVK